MTDRVLDPLKKITAPDSIAIFGASNNYATMGTGILASLLELDFNGPIFPIHPKEKQVAGLKTFTNLEDVPGIPDLAIVVLPTALVPDTIERCGKKGIRHAIVISGGFKENGKDGAQLEERLKQIAATYGLRFLGPNCIGVANPHHHFNATFFQKNCVPGFIGMVSQSGSFVTQMFDYLVRFGLGFSTGISVGNEADIDLIDGLQHLAQCPQTSVIGLYIESIRRGRQFVQAARAISPRKPIVAYYVGGSEGGRRAGLSHTGALAGPDRLYDGIFKQSGIIRACTIEELFDFCWVLGACPLPHNDHMIIQTHSGGPGAAAADAASRAGLTLPPLPEDMGRKLAPLMPHTGSLSNPVDLTYAKSPLDYYSSIPKILLDDPRIGGLLTYFLLPQRMVISGLKQLGVPSEELDQKVLEFIQAQARDFTRQVFASGKPCIGFSFRDRQDTLIKSLQDKGLPILPSPERASRAMGALTTYVAYRKKLSNSQQPA